MPTPQARRRRAIIEIVVVSLVFLSAQWWSDNQRDAAIRSALTAEREAASLPRCRERNSGSERDRRDTLLIVDGFDTYTVGDPEAQAFIAEQIRPQLSTPAETDTDCNANGILDRGDYLPRVYPAGLPIPLPVDNAG